MNHWHLFFLPPNPLFMIISDYARLQSKYHNLNLFMLIFSSWNTIYLPPLIGTFVGCLGPFWSLNGFFLNLKNDSKDKNPTKWPVLCGYLDSLIVCWTRCNVSRAFHSKQIKDFSPFCHEYCAPKSLMWKWFGLERLFLRKDCIKGENSYCISCWFVIYLKATSVVYTVSEVWCFNSFGVMTRWTWYRAPG